MHRSFLAAAFVAVALAPALPASADYAETAAAQAAANSKPGLRHAPPRDIPVPTDEVSPQEQAVIGAPYLPIFNAHPKDAAEWKELVNRLADAGAKGVPPLAEKLGVTVTPTTIGGVKCYIVEPKAMPERTATGFSSMFMAAAMSLGRGSPRRARP